MKQRVRGVWFIKIADHSQNPHHKLYTVYKPSYEERKYPNGRPDEASV